MLAASHPQHRSGLANDQISSVNQRLMESAPWVPTHPLRSPFAS